MFIGVYVALYSYALFFFSIFSFGGLGGEGIRFGTKSAKILSEPISAGFSFSIVEHVSFAAVPGSACAHRIDHSSVARSTRLETLENDSG